MLLEVVPHIDEPTWEQYEEQTGVQPASRPAATRAPPADKQATPKAKSKASSTAAPQNAAGSGRNGAVPQGAAAAPSYGYTPWIEVWHLPALCTFQDFPGNICLSSRTTSAWKASCSDHALMHAVLCPSRHACPPFLMFQQAIHCSLLDGATTLHVFALCRHGFMEMVCPMRVGLRTWPE